MESVFNPSLIRDDSPCKGCHDRHEACHGSCEQYEIWKKEVNRVNEERKKYQRLEKKRRWSYKGVMK